MSEWWTYTLSDFLLFSPRTYYRLIERHNAAVWPAHIAALALGAAVLALLRRPAPWQGRAVAGMLALLWAWVGWAFVGGRYATINWAAGYLAWLFAIEAALLAWIGVARGGLRFRADRSRAGLMLYVAALALYPLLSLPLGRGAAQAETFGVTPDPTAVGTVGLLLLAEGPGHGALLAPAIAWCLVAAATLWAMGSPEAWLPALAIAAATAAGWRSRATGMRARR
jgi:hypothetical protein